MPAVPAMSEHAIIIALILAFAAGLLVCIVVALRPGPLDDLGFDKNCDLKKITAHDRYSPRWFGGILVALALIALTSWMSQRDERDRAAGATPRHAPRVIVDLNDCPAPKAGDTDIILLVVKTQADAQPEWQDCIRIVERGRMRQQLKAKPVIADAR